MPLKDFFKKKISLAPYSAETFFNFHIFAQWSLKDEIFFTWGSRKSSCEQLPSWLIDLPRTKECKRNPIDHRQDQRCLCSTWSILSLHNLLSMFHLYIFACFFLFKGLVLYVFGYCPYLLLVLVQKRSEIFADRSRDWHPGDSGVASQLRDWETAEGFWSQKKPIPSIKKPRRGGKTSCFWRLPWISAGLLVVMSWLQAEAFDFW